MQSKSLKLSWLQSVVDGTMFSYYR